MARTQDRALPEPSHKSAATKAEARPSVIGGCRSPVACRREEGPGIRYRVSGLTLLQVESLSLRRTRKCSRGSDLWLGRSSGPSPRRPHKSAATNAGARPSVIGGCRLPVACRHGEGPGIGYQVSVMTPIVGRGAVLGAALELHPGPKLWPGRSSGPSPRRPHKSAATNAGSPAERHRRQPVPGRLSPRGGSGLGYQVSVMTPMVGRGAVLGEDPEAQSGSDLWRGRSSGPSPRRPTSRLPPTLEPGRASSAVAGPRSPVAAPYPDP